MQVPVRTIDRRRQVIVVGGGSAGWVAAVAAARGGSDVLLTERYGFLGGTASGVLLPGFGNLTSVTQADDAGTRFGIPDELIGRLGVHGGAVGVHSDGWVARGTVYDKEVLKFVSAEMVAESGAEILYHAQFVDCVVEDGVVRGVVLATKDGLRYIPADVVIDCTGDGDVFASAGAPFEKRGWDGRNAPTSMVFKMANVDEAVVRDYVVNHPENFHPESDAVLEGTKPMSILGFYEQVAAAVEAGEYSPHMATIGLHFTLRQGEVIMNMIHTVEIDGTDPWSVTRSEVEGRREAFRASEMVRRRLPGFDDAHLVEMGVQAGTRESRRVVGDYQLSHEDVLTAARFPDGVLRAGGTLSRHDPEGKVVAQFLTLQQPYEIPYRCMVPQVVEGLLVGGRCISTGRGGPAMARSAGVALAIGEVVGTGAALAVKGGVRPRALDVDLLRHHLRLAGTR